MIKYNGKLYSDYIDLMFTRIRNKQPIKVKIFPDHTLFYCRAALEHRFKRKFKLAEVKELIKDMPKTSTTSRYLDEKPLEVHT